MPLATQFRHGHPPSEGDADAGIGAPCAAGWDTSEIVIVALAAVAETSYGELGDSHEVVLETEALRCDNVTVNADGIDELAMMTRETSRELLSSFIAWYSTLSGFAISLAVSRLG